jgi:hypothetical protein
VIANPGGATDGVDLYSREYQTATQRPKLSILYTPAPTPSMPGDFNLDDVIDDLDIDMLFAAIGVRSTDPAFNVDGIGGVDRQDVDFLVRSILSTEYGDADLDGSVDATDFGTWQSNRYQSRTGWARADFDGDGVTDGTDFNLWNLSRFANGPAAASVPRIPRASLNADVQPVIASLVDVAIHRIFDEAFEAATGNPCGDFKNPHGQVSDVRSAESQGSDFESRTFLKAVRYMRSIHERRAASGQNIQPNSSLQSCSRLAVHQILASEPPDLKPIVRNPVEISESSTR